MGSDTDLWGAGPFQSNTICVVLVALLLRSIISELPYSGYAKPPMYGDFEAQRHWQEITINLPIREWYTNSSQNDLQYWGLDYPPLTAYHSWLMGRAAQRLDQSYVQLFKSRGITDVGHKFFMRATVLVADLLIYIPAMYIACSYVFKKLLEPTFKNRGLSALHLGVVLLYPAQILIDNGHFQYNNISLALSALAVVALITDRPLLGSALFSMALNYKQMVLYHALPVFVFLLKHCFQSSGGFTGIAKRIVTKGLTVIAVFGLLWAPWLVSVESTLQVLHRIFPVARGVIEDKVANVWCVVNIVIPLKQIIPNERMALVCMVCTLVASIPSLIAVWKRPSPKQLILTLVNTSLAFFLLSFQVHEKSVLLVAIPVALYFPLDPLPCLIFLQTTTFSMLPLLRQDDLMFPSVVLSLLYIFAISILIQCHVAPSATRFKWDLFHFGDLFVSSSPAFQAWSLVVFYATLVLQLVCAGLLAFGRPPEKLPHLFPLLVAVVSAAYFGAFFLYSNGSQWMDVLEGAKKGQQATGIKGKKVK